MAKLDDELPGWKPYLGKAGEQKCLEPAHDLKKPVQCLAAYKKMWRTKCCTHDMQPLTIKYPSEHLKMGSFEMGNLFSESAPLGCSFALNVGHDGLADVAKTRDPYWNDFKDPNGKRLSSPRIGTGPCKLGAPMCRTL